MRTLQRKSDPFATKKAVKDEPNPLEGLVRSKTHFLSKGALFIGEDFFQGRLISACLI